MPEMDYSAYPGDSVRRWQPYKYYTAGSQIVSPDNNIVTALANFTSGATYLASNWVYPVILNSYGLSVGQSAMPRYGININAATVATNNLRLTYFTSTKSETVTKSKLYTGGVAAAATPTVCRVGLYAVAANGDLTLVASTPNDTSMFSAINTEYIKNFSVPYLISAGVRYALGVIVVTAATAPNLVGSSLVNAVITSSEPRIFSVIGSVSDLPSSVAVGSVVNTTYGIYGEIAP